MKTYFLQPSVKKANVFGAYVLLLVSIIFSVVIYLDPSIKTVPPAMFWAIFLLVIAPLFTGIATLQRVKKPEIEISDNDLKLRRGIGGIHLTKETILNWSDIEAIVVQQDANWDFGPTLPSLFSTRSAPKTIWTRPLFGIQHDRRAIKFVVKRRGTPKEVFFSLIGIEAPDELLSDLKEKVPDIKSSDLMKDPRLRLGISLETELKFGKLVLSNRGIRKAALFGSDDFIPWIRVRSLVAQSKGSSLAGYSPIKINYRGEKGEESFLIINPRVSRKYQELIKYLVRHSSQASIDPTLFKVFEYEPKEVYFDFFSLFLIIAAFFVQFIAIYFMSQYTPMNKTMPIYAIMIFVFTVPPIYVTVKYLAARESRGERHSIFKKTTWAIVSILMPIMVSLALLIVSPFTRYHFSAVEAMQQHDLATAKKYYEKAFAIEPEDLALNFNMGVFYRETRHYEDAVERFEKIYMKIPCWGGPESAVLLPDTLYLLKRYDDALAWCDRMLKCDNQQRGVRTALIKTKRSQIDSVYKSIKQ